MYTINFDTKHVGTYDFFSLISYASDTEIIGNTVSVKLINNGQEHTLDLLVNKCDYSILVSVLFGGELHINTLQGTVTASLYDKKLERIVLLSTMQFYSARCPHDTQYIRNALYSDVWQMSNLDSVEYLIASLTFNGKDSQKEFMHCGNLYHMTYKHESKTFRLFAPFMSEYRRDPLLIYFESIDNGKIVNNYQTSDNKELVEAIAKEIKRTANVG